MRPVPLADWLAGRREPVSERPDYSWAKADITAWLDRQGIEYPAKARKAELLNLVE